MKAEMGISIDIIEMVEVEMLNWSRCLQQMEKWRSGQRRFGNGHHPTEGKKEGLDISGEKILKRP